MLDLDELRLLRFMWVVLRPQLVVIKNLFMDPGSESIQRCAALDRVSDRNRMWIHESEVAYESSFYGLIAGIIELQPSFSHSFRALLLSSSRKGYFVYLLVERQDVYWYLLQTNPIRLSDSCYTFCTSLSCPRTLALQRFCPPFSSFER